jgi:hypothetical protein
MNKWLPDMTSKCRLIYNKTTKTILIRLKTLATSYFALPDYSELNNRTIEQ